jgi:hypothetical protein
MANRPTAGTAQTVTTKRPTSPAVGRNGTRSGRLPCRDRGQPDIVGIGTSLFLIAVGAILYFAVNAHVQGLEISTVGLILMVVGAIGLLISLFLLSSARRGPAERTVIRDRDVY